MWWARVFFLVVSLKPASSFSERFLGCYNKTITSKHIGKPSKRNQNMTRSLCAEYCLSQNLLVYGLQFGTYCYCRTNDKEFTRFGRVEAVECNTLCAGGPKCGGNDFVAVYNGSDYYKCYQLGGDTLSKFGGKVKNLKMDTCLQTCEDRFKYAYLTQGNKCYCSDKLPLTAQLDDSTCLIRGHVCLGEERCGGGAGVIAVWRIVPLTVYNSTHGNLEEEGPNDKDQQGDMPPFTDILKENLVWTILVTFVLGFISATIISYGRQTYFLRSRMSKLKQRLRRKRTQKKIKSLINYKDENYLRRSVHFIEEVGTAVTNVNSSTEAEPNSAQDKEKPSKPSPPPKLGVTCNRYYKKYEKETPAPRVSIYQDAELYSNIVLNNKMQKPTRKKPVNY